jgi:hypothetical protein
LDPDVGESESGEGGLVRRLTAVSIVVGILVAGTGLAFELRPGLRPCLGEERAAFTGAPVFPQVRLREYLRRVQDLTEEEAALEPEKLGAEVRFTYETEGFRGEDLPVSYSLVTVERDGTLRRLVPGFERELAFTVRPEACSGTGGVDLFVDIPATRQRRYRVILELYRDTTFANRLALMETAPFLGGRSS